MKLPKGPVWWWVPWFVAATLLAIGIPLRSTAQAETIYFAATGHHLSDQYGFLSFWRANNGERLLGYPVTEPLEENGLLVQYFERGRLERHSELADEPLLLGLVGREYVQKGWRTFAKPDPKLLAADATIFPQTGYSLSEPFKRFWQEYGGVAQFGYPISEPRWEFLGSGQVLVQYFERARLEHHPLYVGTPFEIQASLLGREVAVMRGYSIAPVPNTASQTYGQPLLQEPIVPTATPVVPTAAPEPTPEPLPEPTPVLRATTAEEAAAVIDQAAALNDEAVSSVPAASTGAGKSIVVSIGAQWLYAYEDGVLVYSAPVSTGRDGFNTPIGNYSVYSKLPVQTMSGVLGGEYYNVPDVPSVMYVVGGVALHGTYWHNMFGTGVRMSHGCINLPMGEAAWLYDWAPVGTPVQITY